MTTKIRSLLLVFALVGGVQFAWSQEVNGIYTDSTTKDLGDITKVDALKGIKFRGWIEGYFQQNFNHVQKTLANSNQASSAIQSRDLTIEGRTFDVHSNSFTFDLAEIELEKVPDRGGVGFKVDLAYGDITDIITDTIKFVSPNSVSAFDRMFQHASLSYLAPVGQGLRLDFGKFVTHIGGETIESVKNRNFSHSFFYSYAIPFQDTGIRMNYAFSSKAYVEGYVLNGWNVTSDNNSAKTLGGSLGLTPSSKFSLYANYLGGPERNENKDDWRHLGDFQVIVSPTTKLQAMLNIDVAKDKNAVSPGRDAEWEGVTLYIRPNIADRFFPTVRVEYYNDRDGFTTGVAQHLWGYTFTADTKLGPKDGFAHLLFRPEMRYDTSTARFFSTENNLRSRRFQLTVGAGLVVYF
jgi:hypothetical protein